MKYAQSGHFLVLFTPMPTKKQEEWECSTLLESHQNTFFLTKYPPPLQSYNLPPPPPSPWYKARGPARRVGLMDVTGYDGPRDKSLAGSAEVPRPPWRRGGQYLMARYTPRARPPLEAAQTGWRAQAPSYSLLGPLQGEGKYLGIPSCLLYFLHSSVCFTFLFFLYSCMCV